MSKVHDYVRSLAMRRNESHRSDCPECGGNNTFIVSNENGKKLFYCFRASCNTRGIESSELGMSNLEAELKRLVNGEPAVVQSRYKIPNSFTILNKECVEWLHKYNSIEYYDKLINRNNYFYWDKIKDRLVFVERRAKDSSPSLVIGRSLNGDSPKWYKYFVNVEQPYWIASNGKPDTYIVEDCFSAASLARIASSVALCGTNWDALSLVNSLAAMGTQRAIICLDADAQDKALKLKKDLEGLGNFKKVLICRLSDDAKYLSYEQLQYQLFDKMGFRV